MDGAALIFGLLRRLSALVELEYMGSVLLTCGPPCEPQVHRNLTSLTLDCAWTADLPGLTLPCLTVLTMNTVKLAPLRWISGHCAALRVLDLNYALNEWEAARRPVDVCPSLEHLESMTLLGSTATTLGDVLPMARNLTRLVIGFRPPANADMWQALVAIAPALTLRELVLDTLQIQFTPLLLPLLARVSPDLQLVVPDECVRAVVALAHSIPVLLTCRRHCV